MPPRMDGEPSTTIRLDGFGSCEALSKDAQRMASFHVAFCLAMKAYEEKRRLEPGGKLFRLSVRGADKPEAREFIANYASKVLDQKVLSKPARGGFNKNLFLYKGRTLMDYYNVFKGLDPSLDARDALVPLSHRKGNWVPRISNDVIALIYHHTPENFLDLKGGRYSDVQTAVKDEIEEINRLCGRNELPLLKVPSLATVKAYIEKKLSPIEIAVAQIGPQETHRRFGKGSTDIRALMIGEMTGMDECKLSLITLTKKSGFWEKLSQDDKAYLEKVDEYVKKRLHILVLVDLASRMPLAWVIAENPSAEATKALLAMATRDKTREKEMYECQNDPACAVGLLQVKNDNGTGLRNESVVTSLMGLGASNIICRTFSPTDRAAFERPFGTLEMDVVRWLPGYTGGRPGQLPGYDAMKNGVVGTEALYRLVSRYFIDEYPLTPHYGVGMNGRRPVDVYKEINEKRGMIAPIDPNIRRIHLGWTVSVTPTDEGVRVFGGIWFNSTELQVLRDRRRVKGKVKVFVDPDNLTIATVVIPRVEEPVEVHLQMTAWADMTLPEVLRSVKLSRAEDPKLTTLYDDQLRAARARRKAEVKKIGVENNLPRSYSTFEDCKKMGQVVFAGSLCVHNYKVPGTVAADDIMLIGSQEEGDPGTDESLIDLTAVEVEADEVVETAESPEGRNDLQVDAVPDSEDDAPKPSPARAKHARKLGAKSQPQQSHAKPAVTWKRPTQIKELE